MLRSLAVGCSRDANLPGSPALAPRLAAAAPSANRSPVVLTQNGETPAGVLAVSLGSEMLRLWPYTGESMDGAPSDPKWSDAVGGVHTRPRSEIYRRARSTLKRAEVWRIRNGSRRSGGERNS